jgi:hypothetical protein
VSSDGCNETKQCVSCGAALTEKFCANCGEQVLDRRDYSLFAFLREAFAAMTTIDNKLYRSMKYLLIKPGFLTQEYFIGRRKRYLKPIQLFLIANILFFLYAAAVGFNPFALPLNMHPNTIFFQDAAERMVDAKIQQQGLERKVYAERYNTKIEVISKTLIIVDIPLYAMMLLLCFWRQRRFYVEHLAFSCHLFTALLIIITAVGAIFDILAKVTGHEIFGGNFIMAPIILLILVYLVISARRFYQQHLLLICLKALFLTLGFVVLVTQIYRTILFFVTFYTI